MPSQTYDASIHTHVNAVRSLGADLANSSVSDYPVRFETITSRFVYFFVDMFALYEGGRFTESDAITVLDSEDGFEFIRVDRALCWFYSEAERLEERGEPDSMPARAALIAYRAVLAQADALEATVISDRKAMGIIARNGAEFPLGEGADITLGDMLFESLAEAEFYTVAQIDALLAVET